MKTSVTIAVATLASLLAAHSVAATADPEIVDLEVIVEPIAILEVIKQSTTVLISDTQLAGWPAPLANLGRIRLSTNFCITAVVLDFPRVTGIRGFPSHYYGKATGLSTGNTLGVNPFAVSTGIQAHGGVGWMFAPSNAPLPGGTNKPLTLSGSSNDFCPEPGGASIFDIYLGVVSKWDLTLPSEPHFAVPDTYRIPITATITP
jgi:hypothetical protein